MIYVDDTWKGQHGIGRYSSEVLSRLLRPWHPIVDLRARRNWRWQTGAGVLYSPGFRGHYCRIPQVLTLHDLIHLRVRTARRPLYRAYYETVLRPIIKRNRVVLTVSQASQEALIEWIRDDRVEVINAGIGISPEFVTEPDQRGAASSGTEPFVLFVGNLKRHKNPEVVFRAMKRVKEGRLVVVGAATEPVREMAERFEVAHRVTHISGVSDKALADWYRKACATVMPSTLEGFGLPAAESLACGTPVIYWRGCTSVRETVGANGLALSAHDDADSWSAAITYALNGGLEQPGPIDDRFSWDSVARRVEEVISRYA